MRTNTTKAKLARGETVLGLEIYSADPNLVDMAGVLGFDFVTLDIEHEPADEVAVAYMIRAAEAAGITPIVRLHPDRASVLHYLNARAQGIQIPRVNSAAEVRAAVDACFYYPEGKRTFYAVGPSGDYGVTGGNPADRAYAEASNRELLLTCMVEETEGMRNLEEIVRVPEVDIIQIAGRDLWQSMGMPNDPAVVEAQVLSGIETAVAAGKHVLVTIEPNPDMGREVATFVGQGVRSFNISSRRLVVAGAQAFFASVRQALP